MTAPVRSPRVLALLCAGLAVAAVALWGASTATWYRLTVVLPARGEQVVAFTGEQVAPALVGIALLALAGVAALVATGGVVRRVLGGLLAVPGVVVAVDALRQVAGPAGSLPGRPGVPAEALADAAVAATGAALLAVAGGLLLVAVGVAVVVREPVLPRFGARYAAPGSRPPVTDPDRAAWADLDAGRDPTAEARDDPGGGPSGRAV